MPLVSLADLMDEAERGDYAVPAFNAYNVESAESIIRTAEKLHDWVRKGYLDSKDFRIISHLVGESLDDFE